MYERLVRNPFFCDRVHERTQRIHSSVTSKVRNVDLLKFSTISRPRLMRYKPVRAWFSVTQKVMFTFSSTSFFKADVVVNNRLHPIQQKCVNGPIELACYEHAGTTFSPERRPREPSCRACRQTRAERRTT